MIICRYLSCTPLVCLLALLLASPAAYAMRIPQSYVIALNAYRDAAQNHDILGLQRAAELAKRAMNAPEADARLIEARSMVRVAELYYYNGEKRQSATALRAASIAMIRAELNEPRFTSRQEFLATKALIALLAEELDVIGSLPAFYRTFDPHTALPRNVDAPSILYARMRAAVAVEDWPQAGKLLQQLAPLAENQDELAVFIAFVAAKLDSARTQESIVFYSRLLAAQPYNQLARHYRGQLFIK